MGVWVEGSDDMAALCRIAQASVPETDLSGTYIGYILSFIRSTSIITGTEHTEMNETQPPCSRVLILV